MIPNKYPLVLLQLCCIILPFLIVGSVSYELNSEWKGISHTIKNEQVPIIPSDGEIQKISTPQGMRKTNAYRHTSEIGTANDPTIDGGIINAADGLGVNQPSIKIVKVQSESKTHENSANTQRLSPDSSKSKSENKFSDEWATSTRVRNILNEAIKAGKLDYVLSQSKSQHLPASVALVPIVESAYKNNAVSNKGAVGSWQLMPETAIENGINPEERTDFVPSTQAALHFLSQLHQKFGSWELAFAAYNAGSARVAAALQKNPQASHIRELDLPQETKNYVLRLMKINKALISDESYEDEIKVKSS